jgi:hypothetical protein
VHRCSPKTILKCAAWVSIWLLVTVVSYAGLATGLLFLFASLFPPSGHPPLPAAPSGWYTLGFLVLCPLLALALALGAVCLVRRQWRRRALCRDGPEPPPPAT